LNTKWAQAGGELFPISNTADAAGSQLLQTTIVSMYTLSFLSIHFTPRLYMEGACWRKHFTYSMRCPLPRLKAWGNKWAGQMSFIKRWPRSLL